MRIVFSLLVSCVLIFSGCISLFHQGGNEIHVAVNGSDLNAGSKSAPLETIQAAAEKAMPGDTVTVHAGIYREHINPPRGGISDSKRITFQAAQGEDVTITGSEPAKGWVKESGDTWKLTLPNSYFGKFNPFASTVLGDWFDPRGRVHHLGMVYLNGEWMAEAVSGEEVLKPMTATPLWFASVDPTSTVIRAQFPGIDPNRADVEIAKRYTVFTPEKTNIDYITVRGFKLKNAASNWAAPTSGQHGLVTAYWCKGWIIEDNEISHSRCCGIALGKYSDAWDNKRGSQKGYHATIVDALKTGGWHKDKIGGHHVRRNHIHHCGQTGIVGSLGCAFSRVENNEIHDINKQGIWGGAEMAGIKFHGAIDTVISGNHIYRCGASGGLWLDWMSQGVQVTGNLLHDNENCDIFTEVNHGPHVIANNILLSPVSYHSCSSGGAYAHNLITGGVNAAPDGRQTPYHQAHSTEVAGRRDSPLGDVRWYNNLLAGKSSLTSYDKASLPVAAAGNVFTKGAQSSTFDEAALLKPDFDPGITLTQQLDGWYLELKVDKAWATEQKRRVVGTEMLGKAVIPDLPFENADGSPLQIDTDYFGKKRETTNPFPGPFEVKESGKQKIKVWPLASPSGRGGAPNFWDEIPLSPSTKLPSVVLDDYWNSEFQRVNREVADAQNTQLIFLGDSITWSWTLGPETGKEIWEKQFAAYKPINMGNSGDITPVMLHRVTRGNLDFADGQHPKVAVLMCGINNLGVSQSAGGREKWYLGAHCPPADIANGIRAIAQVFRRRLPGTRLIMMATLPVSDEVKRATCRQASAINAALARNDNEVAYVDLQDKFMLPDGSLNKQLFTDGTHLTPEGYRVWAKGIEPLVLKFMEAPPLKPVKIMLIGDSMTEGADSDGSYRRCLDGMLRRDGQLIDFVGSRKKHNDDKTEPANYEYDVDHEGHWGKDSAWMAENMQSLLTRNVPDVAVIHLGTEDILSSNAVAESLADGIVKNIGKVVDTLRARNGKMKIVLSTIIPVAGKQDVVNLVNLKISRYVQSNSTHPCPVVLADPCKGFDVSRDLAADGAHPNASGARKMARVCADVILLTAFPVRADGLAAPVPATADFWVRDQPGRITHACGGKEPVVLCMQGRKVVMQVQCDSTNGLSYTARFFNLQKEVEKKQVLFVAGREATPELLVNDQPWKSEFPSSVAFDGMLTLTYPEAGGVVVTRTVYPSMTKALVIEEWQVRNTTGKRVAVTVAPARTVKPVGKDIAIVWSCPEVKTAEVKAGGVLSFFTCVQAGLAAAPDPAVNVAAERGARQALIEASWRGPGRLETPDPLLDHAFALQKLHVLESPIETFKGVITHNGSLTYSPGIWANDPPEYSSPLFPFFGDAELNKASMNMYRVWLDYSREHGDAIPGCFWQPTLQVGQWERGDDAMILYGLSKFLLFQGDKAAAEEMWPLIEMCAASVLKHTTAEGIVASESDEMEGRYPTGKANLSTSSLAYGGYRLAARLAQSLGKTDVANIYDTRAAALRKAIESYFGGEVEGFKTYRYYKENTVLRGWILLPLAMGITERQNATLDAMVSDQLWPTRMQGGDILAASDRRETEWGRETYYALRVMFKAGRTEQALDLTRRVVKAQIFGARGPYPDEDAIDMLCPGSLYPRVFTEGMFGIVPTGLDSFECTPWLPKDWPRMALRDIRAFGQSWDLVVERVGDQQKVTVLSGGKTLMTGSGPAGKTYALSFPVAGSAKPVRETSSINEPYPYISTGSFSGPAVPESPDPLVAYRWPKPKATDGLEIYLQKPSAVSSDTKESFDNLGSLTTDHPNVTVNGAGSIRMDFGAELPAWVEFDSADCPGDVEMSISEYNQPGPDKTKAPVKHGTTYRLELNAELYEGVRFAWIHVKAPAKPWHITGIRAVCQVKPTNYRGRFSCSDPLLTKIWYMSAYGVKASLCKDYFGAILMDRGDRMSWTGDAHTSQAAALAAFGNFDFIRKNIDNTSQESNGIRSYSLYWVLSLLDYYRYTGDAETLLKYIDNVSKKLDDAYAVFGTDPKLKFYGHDERIGACFEIWFRGGSGAQEAQNAYKMLSIRAWKEFAAVMGQYGRVDLRDKYNGYADGKMAELRRTGDWSAVFGLHAAADAITTGSLNAKEKDTLLKKHFLDRVNRLSLSPFNQYFILQAMALTGKHDDALSAVRDMWGGMVNYGGTTTFEVYRPSWNEAIGPNDAVPNAQCGIVSLCHPWGAGVVKWLSEEVLGIVSTTPGFKTYDILPHPGRTLTQVSGEMPTPAGNICASFDLVSGHCSVTAPTGTVGRIGIPKTERSITSITMNGKLAWNGKGQVVDGISGASQDAEFVYFTGVQPGTYDFVIAYRGTTPKYDEPPVKYDAQFVKLDKTTQGDWGGVYGKDGYVLCNYKGDRNDGKALPTRLIRGEREEVILDIRNDEKALPSYVTSLEYFRAFPKSGMPDPQMWAAETADKRALAPDKHNGSNRKAAGYSNSGETMSVTIGIDGEREYQVALYFVDWNKNGCCQAVEMMDAETLNQVAPVKIVDDFSGGAYLVYQYNKSVKFRINKVRGSLISLSGIFFDPASVEETTMKLLNGVQQRWTEEKANAWYQQQPWLVGCNFVPSTAVNAIEMWQTETFDPVTIERELGWAKQMGFNTVRVFHNFVVWKADADGLKKRFDQFLAIASKLGIRAMPVLFDDCNFAGGVPHSGKQPEPTPLVHNSQWVGSPPPAMVSDMNAWPELERYVKDMVTSYKNDPRIVIWDLYNEPSAVGSDLLLAASFRWARACSPAQPLTFGAWEGWNKYTDAIIAQSDVISFHCYASKDGVLGRITDLKKHGRPVICSEWMSRPAGSRFDIDLPMFKKEQVGCYQWGLVNGRTQTHLVMHDPKEPVLWQHDILHRDGTPYSPAEIYAIKHATGIIATPPTTLVPTSEDQQITWSFTTDTPAGEWSKPGFDESAWKKGKAPFASNDRKPTTEWKSADIWIRRVIELPAEVKGLVALRIQYDDEAEVYLNGIFAARLSGYIANYALHSITPEARASLQPGRNLVAIHCHNKAGGQFVDAGLVLLDEGKPEKSQ